MYHTKHFSPVRRVIALGLIISLVFVVLLARGFYLQAGESGEANRARALKDSLRVEPLAAPRGDIIDRRGRVLVTGAVEREYPYGETAAHLLGYMGKVNQDDLETPHFHGFKLGEPAGKWGVERFFEVMLRGRAGSKLIEVDARDQAVRTLRVKPALSGNHVRLAVDIQLQQIAEGLLADQVGAIILMEANTGYIRVLASAPGLSISFRRGIGRKEFDELTKDPRYPLLYRPINIQYPLADLFGSWSDFVDPEVVSGDTPDLSALIDLVRIWGLGAPTDIDLPFETEGTVPGAVAEQAADGSSTKPELRSPAVFAGKVLVTPLQVARLTAAHANGGLLLRPLVIEEILDGQAGEPLMHFVPEAERILESSALLPAGAWASSANGMLRYRSAVSCKSEAGITSEHCWYTGFTVDEKPRMTITVLLEGVDNGEQRAEALAAALLQAHLNASMEVL